MKARSSRCVFCGLSQGFREGTIIDRNVYLIMNVIIESINSTLDQNFYMENRIAIVNCNIRSAF